MLSVSNIANKFNSKIFKQKSTPTIDNIVPKFGVSNQLINDTIQLRSHFQVLLDDFGVANSPQELGKVLLSKFAPKNIIGEGAESRAFLINDKYVLKIPRYVGDSYVEALSDIKVLNPSDDGLLGLRNFGQAIAEAQNGVSISKLVKGTPLYSSLPAKWIDYDLGNAKINRKDSDSYLSQFKKIVDIPDMVLSRYINDVIFLKEKEYKVDFVNPNNFLYDKSAMQLNIIDVEQSKNKFYSSAMLPVNIMRPLIDGYNLLGYYSYMKPVEREYLLESISNLYTRIHSVYDSIVGEQKTLDSIPIPVEEFSCLYLRGLNGFDFYTPSLKQALSRYYDLD